MANVRIFEKFKKSVHDKAPEELLIDIFQSKIRGRHERLALLDKLRRTPAGLDTIKKAYEEILTSTYNMARMIKQLGAHVDPKDQSAIANLQAMQATIVVHVDLVHELHEALVADPSLQLGRKNLLILDGDEPTYIDMSEKCKEICLADFPDQALIRFFQTACHDPDQRDMFLDQLRQTTDGIDTICSAFLALQDQTYSTFQLAEIARENIKEADYQETKDNVELLKASWMMNFELVNAFDAVIKRHELEQQTGANLKLGGR